MTVSTSLEPLSMQLPDFRAISFAAIAIGGAPSNVRLDFHGNSGERLYYRIKTQNNNIFGAMKWTYKIIKLFGNFPLIQSLISKCIR